MRILLVDDDLDQVRRYRAVIMALGHDVVAVSEPFVARDLLKEESFDVLVSDVQMPRMSGFELVQRMYYFKQEIPTLLHSSEPRHSTGQMWIDLTTIHEDFNFVTFRQKNFSVEPTYIRDFLETVTQRGPGA